MPTELMMMLLADARLPVAGHTQSGGLEPAVMRGLTAGEIPVYVAVRLETVTRVEAAVAVVALEQLRRRAPLDTVIRAWAARTPSAALRDSSRRQGRALARIAARLWPQSPPLAQMAAIPTPRAVVLAAAARAGGIGPLSLAHLVGYDDVQTVISAGLKLLPLDPALATTWARDALPAVTAMARGIHELTEPTAIPAGSAPHLELWAEAHAHTTRRLFSA